MWLILSSFFIHCSSTEWKLSFMIFLNGFFFFLRFIINILFWCLVCTWDLIHKVMLLNLGTYCRFVKITRNSTSCWRFSRGKHFWGIKLWRDIRSVKLASLPSCLGWPSSKLIFWDYSSSILTIGWFHGLRYDLLI